MKLWKALAGRATIALLAMTIIGLNTAHGAKILSSKSERILDSDRQTGSTQPVVVDMSQGEPSQVSGALPVEGQIDWQVISSGGLTFGRSVDYLHSGTINQTAIGSGMAGNLVINHGFWQTPPHSASDCCSNPGDANSDGETNVGDAVFIVNYVFRGGAPPACHVESDPNGDCEVNIGDAVYMIWYCFKEGHTPSCGCSK